MPSRRRTDRTRIERVAVEVVASGLVLLGGRVPRMLAGSTDGPAVPGTAGAAAGTDQRVTTCGSGEVFGRGRVEVVCAGQDMQVSPAFQFSR